MASQKERAAARMIAKRGPDYEPLPPPRLASAANVSGDDWTTMITAGAAQNRNRRGFSANLTIGTDDLATASDVVPHENPYTATNLVTVENQGRFVTVPRSRLATGYPMRPVLPGSPHTPVDQMEFIFKPRPSTIWRDGVKITIPAPPGPKRNYPAFCESYWIAGENPVPITHAYQKRLDREAAEVKRQQRDERNKRKREKQEEDEAKEAKARKCKSVVMLWRAQHPELAAAADALEAMKLKEAAKPKPYVAPPTFHGFPRLPRELRQKILGIAFDHGAIKCHTDQYQSKHAVISCDPYKNPLLPVLCDVSPRTRDDMIGKHGVIKNWCLFRNGSAMPRMAYVLWMSLKNNSAATEADYRKASALVSVHPLPGDWKFADLRGHWVSIEYPASGAAKKRMDKAMAKQVSATKISKMGWDVIVTAGDK
ncbi:MAG: hypothetical protein M1828_000594 [Chrysothrix sp. TS-e1954]|nr:MAG: hypothetical protein M1828_000594 [Chrysothrix sp. TS-e1954]